MRSQVLSSSKSSMPRPPGAALAEYAPLRTQAVRERANTPPRAMGQLGDRRHRCAYRSQKAEKPMVRGPYKESSVR